MPDKDVMVSARSTNPRSSRSARTKSRGPVGGLLALGAAVMLAACARPTHSETLRELERVIDESSRASIERFESPEALAEYVQALEEARQAHVQSPSPPSSYAYDDEGAALYDYDDNDAAAFIGEEGGVAVYDFADDSIDGEMLTSGAQLQTRTSLTNTQEAAVDEGGIVKMIGDHLVVLRRGRLFSVDISGRSARPIDAIDISADPSHFAWYDELLVAGNTAVVVGYSYDTGGSELLRFRLDAGGHWHRVDGWVLRSSDYYSSRNYASRLIGSRLVMYTQSSLQADRGSVSLPAIARWDGRRIRRAAWNEVMAATDVYRPVHPTRVPVLHVVIECELAGTPLRCNAQGLVGPSSRSFYVSADAVYVWLHGDRGRSDAGGAEPDATVHRLPFDGSAPGALRTWGMPRDQFSFKERDGMLAVLLSSTGPGDGMWGAEAPSDSPMALMRVPVAAFADGVADVQSEAFIELGRVQSDGWGLVNRFVGDHLLFGEGQPWGGPDDREPSALHALRYVEPAPALQTITLPHSVERIEALGANAVVIGGRRGDLLFSSVELGRDVRRAAEYVEPGAAQGETRSHGFFFSARGPRRGLLGLPVRPGNQPGWAQLVYDAPGVLYLAVDDLQLSPVGALAGDPHQADIDDRCVNSCVDWYGSARPLFIDDRVFALLGYELVEGRVSRGRMQEVRRANLLHTIDGVIVSAPTKRAAGG